MKKTEFAKILAKKAAKKIMWSEFLKKELTDTNSTFIFHNTEGAVLFSKEKIWTDLLFEKNYPAIIGAKPNMTAKIINHSAVGTTEFKVTVKVPAKNVMYGFNILYDSDLRIQDYPLDFQRILESERYFAEIVSRVLQRDEVKSIYYYYEPGMKYGSNEKSLIGAFLVHLYSHGMNIEQ